MNYAFLFWAYSIIWVLMAGYITILLVKLNRLDADVKRLEKKVPD